MDQQTLLDLLDDFDELRTLAENAISRLEIFRRRLKERTVHANTQIALENQLSFFFDAYSHLIQELTAAKSTPETDSAELHDLKDRATDLLRTLQGTTGAMLASIDWQAPSFAHTLRSQAGTQTGKIDGTINDYKRDFHLDANDYESAFRSAFIDAPLQLPPPVYVTASGMAAFSTVLNCLQTEGCAEGNILVGSACYFQNKILLERFFPGRICYADEMNADEVLSAVDKLQPSVIFLDSLCNTEQIEMPNLAALIPAVAKKLALPAILVIDNTGLASSFQPLAHLPRLQGKLQLVVIESLMKYHQYGFDRVTGGLIWRNGLSSMGLSTCRMHLGTNMPDVSVLAIPQPNRNLLTKRLARFERNANYLAVHLDAHIKSRTMSPVSHIVYPGLPSYPGYTWTKDKPFHGSFFTIVFKKPFAGPLFYQRFISLALKEAKEAGLQVTAGTSFGFSNTRIYLTALRAKKHAKPFLRVSVGTETNEQIVKLGDALTRAIDRMLI